MNLARFSWRQLWKGALIWAVVIAIVVVTGVETFKSAYTTDVGTARVRAVDRPVAGVPGALRAGHRGRHGRRVHHLALRRSHDAGRRALGAARRHPHAAGRRGDPASRSARGRSGVAPPADARRARHGGGRLRARAWRWSRSRRSRAGCRSAVRCSSGSWSAAGGVVFGAIAAFTSQLFDTRRRAAGWAGAVLGASYLLRALADGSTRLALAGLAHPAGLDRADRTIHRAGLRADRPRRRGRRRPVVAARGTPPRERETPARACSAPARAAVARGSSAPRSPSTGTSRPAHSWRGRSGSSSSCSCSATSRTTWRASPPRTPRSTT